MRPLTIAATWVGLFAIATFVKVWLIAAQTLFAIAPNAVDDELFASQAMWILRGEWLGPLTELTLAKGPIYPLWLALNNVMGVRLLVSQALLYALACGVFAAAVRPVIRERWMRAVLYVVLLFNPGSWADGPATRVVREGIYPALTVLVLALAIGSALRLRTSTRASVLWAAAAGGVGALLAMTREEGIWLAPAAVLLVALGFVAARERRNYAFASLGAAAVAYAVPTVAVSAVNWSRYGLFETNETRAPYFTSAYGALTRVKASTWNPFVPVPRESRAMLYAVSPAVREVAPHLEEIAPGWSTHGCVQLGVCDDIAGGWFMWALRDAAERAGKYRSGLAARGWYEQIIREVDDACRDGRLACHAARSSLMPPWRAAYVRPFISTLPRAMTYAATFAEVTPRPSAPMASEKFRADFERLTNERVPTPVVRVDGTVESRIGEVSAEVLHASGLAAPASIERISATEAESRGDPGKPRSTRFIIETSCTPGCTLVVFALDRRAIAIPLTEDSGTVDGGDLVWTTRRFERTSRGAPDADIGRLGALALITKVYAVATPPLFVLALVVLCVHACRAARRRSSPELLLIGLALLAAVAARIALLALVDVTSFRAINVEYMSPAYPVIIAFVGFVLLTYAPRREARAERA